VPNRRVLVTQPRPRAIDVAFTICIVAASQMGKDNIHVNWNEGGGVMMTGVIAEL